MKSEIKGHPWSETYKIGNVDFMHAREVWEKFPTKLTNSETFEYWLGEGDWCYYANTDSMTVNKEAYRKIKMLLSPHSETMFRIWLIKEGKL